MSGLSSHARAVAPCKGTSQYSIVHHCITLVYFGSIRSHLVYSIHFCPIQSISVQCRSNSVLFSLFQFTSVDLVYFNPLQLILDLLDLKLIFFVSCLFSFWLKNFSFFFFFFFLIFGLKSMKFYFVWATVKFLAQNFLTFFFLKFWVEKYEILFYLSHS